MPAQPASAALENAPDQQDADRHYYRATLHELIDMGADIARQVHRQAMAQPQTPAPATDPAEPPPDHTIPFDRIARAIRRTVALARHIAEPAAPTPSAPTAPRPASPPGRKSSATSRTQSSAAPAAPPRTPCTPS